MAPKVEAGDVKKFERRIRRKFKSGRYWFCLQVKHASVEEATRRMAEMAPTVGRGEEALLLPGTCCASAWLLVIIFPRRRLPTAQVMKLFEGVQDDFSLLRNEEAVAANRVVLVRKMIPKWEEAAQKQFEAIVYGG